MLTYSQTPGGPSLAKRKFSSGQKSALERRANIQPDSGDITGP